MADHDNGYKLLFSHAETVADFLRGFVKEDWVRELDYSTLKRMEGTYVSDDLRSRESDVVWRVSWRGRPLYVYLLLEFQSTSGADFAKRIEELGDLLRTNPGLRRSYMTWLTRVLLPSRFPGLHFPEIQDLQEIQTMGLAERVMEWTREWKEEGRQEGVRAFQDFLLSEMLERFGPVPSAIRRRVESVQDLDELKKLGKRLLAATSLDDLRL